MISSCACMNSQFGIVSPINPGPLFITLSTACLFLQTVEHLFNCYYTQLPLPCQQFFENNWAIVQLTVFYLQSPFLLLSESWEYAFDNPCLFTPSVLLLRLCRIVYFCSANVFENIPKHFWTSLYIRAFSGGFLPRKRGWMIYNADGRVSKLPLKFLKVIINMQLYGNYCVLESLSTPCL